MRQAIRWASDERRLPHVNYAVLEFMQRRLIAATWGQSDLACSDICLSKRRQSRSSPPWLSYSNPVMPEAILGNG
jgi:hypothetical protein